MQGWRDALKSVNPLEFPSALEDCCSPRISLFATALSLSLPSTDFFRRL